MTTTAINLYCSLQNRLGAMDRVLLAFTHRGIIPSQMFVSQNEENNSLELAITFNSAMGDHDLQKLIKSLQKQIYVLDVRRAVFGKTGSEIDEQDFAPASIASLEPATKIVEAVPA